MERTAHAKFFPTPSFLRFASVGIDVSDQSIKYAELKHMHGELRLGRYGSVVIPPGVIVSGRIQDSRKLAE